MLDRIDCIARYQRKITSWPRAMSMLIVTIVLIVMYFQFIRPLEIYGAGAPHLDVRYAVGYTHADVLEYFETLGAEGRGFYARTTLFDTVWPLCVGFCCALWAPLAFRQSSWVVFASAPAVLFGVLDLAENIGLWTMLFQYPEVSPIVAGVNNFITLSKQLMIPGWAIALPVLPIVAFIRRGKTTKRDR